jgi:hypothetical protein
MKSHQAFYQSLLLENLQFEIYSSDQVVAALCSTLNDQMQMV